MAKTVLGIIGGSGLYDIPQLENIREEHVKSPWGEPSDALRIGEINGMKVVFLARHGRHHSVSPSDINYRANIDAMKRAGVTDIVSISACGSLKEEFAPGDFVMVDQFVDRTFHRAKSFFGKGCVAHVSLAHPVSPLLQNYAYEASKAVGITSHKNGTYVCIEGPQFSTLAESLLYRQWNCDVIGMTNVPESFLAREAEMCYTTVAMVTDYDSWHPDHGAVDIRDIIRLMGENVIKARNLVVQLAKTLPVQHEPCPAYSDTALEYAIMTKPEQRDPALVAKLDAIAGRVL